MIGHYAKDMPSPQRLFGSSDTMPYPLPRRKQTFLDKPRECPTDHNHTHAQLFGEGAG